MNQRLIITFFFHQKLLIFNLLICVFLSFQQSAFSQVDSVQLLKRLIREEKSEYEKAKNLISLSNMLSSQNSEEGISFGKEGVKLAEKQEDNELLIFGLISIGSNYFNANQLDSALFYIHKARLIKIEPPYSNYYIRIFNFLGAIHKRQNCLDSTWFYWQHSLALATESGNPEYLAGVYSNLGTYAKARGDLQQAINHFHEALRCYEQIKNPQNLAIVLNNIGQVNHSMGDLERAINYTTRAALINDSIHSYYHLGMNYGNLGTFYQEKQMPDEAEFYFLKALDIAVKNVFHFEQARALLNLGVLYLNGNKPEKALSNFTESLKISREYGITYGIAQNYNGLADYYFLTGDFAMAEDYLNKTYDIASEYELTDMLLSVYKKKPAIFEKQMKFEQALQFYREYEIFKDSLNVTENRADIEELQTRYETEKKELENQRLKADNENNERIILKQRTIVAATIIILVLVVILALTIFHNRQKVRKTNSELNELNRKIMLQNKQLEELNITKDKLFSIIAHDLRAPFNSLLGFLQMLMDDFDSYSNKEKREMVELVYFQSNNTYSLLENLLQWAMTQRGQISYFPADRDIAILVQSELEFLSNRANKKNISINNHIVTNTIAWVDSNLFKIIIRNIVNNAIKFTERNGTIKLEASTDNEFVLIRISDNGIGMSDEQLKKLLEMKPVKACKGTENESGSGLGLLLVKEFIEMHKARIHVESSLGKGTIFTLSFYRNQPSS